jgi:hypothetical protein
MMMRDRGKRYLGLRYAKHDRRQLSSHTQTESGNGYH